MRLPSIVAARPLSRRVQWWVSFVLFTLLVSVWALADPLFAGPDEPDHLRLASSAAHFEGVGPKQPGGPDNVRLITVPGPFARATTCFGFQPEATAACEVDIDDGDKSSVRFPHAGGRFPPPPYAVIGLPSLVWPSKVGVYLMRIFEAALCGVLFASSLLSLREAKIPWLAVTGLGFALTPMVFFVGSIVNPSSLEIAGGVAFWASGLALVGKARDGVVDGRLVARTAIGAGVLVLARPLGTVWLGAAAVVLLMTCTWPALRRLLRARVVQVWGGVAGLCIAFELGWVTFYDSLGSKTPPGPSAEGLSSPEVFAQTLGTTSQSYREMIGVFGWQDTPAPAVTFVLWTAVLGLLVALGIGLTNRRMAGAIAALLGLIVVVPAVLEFIEARRFGFGWQGRYTLPLAVGLPILCGFALAREPARILDRARLRVLLAIAFVVAHFLAFWQNMRRYTVGYDGPVMFWWDADWSPPFPSLFLLTAFLVLLVALALWLWGGVTAGSSETRDDAEVTAPA